ncbi:nuclear pore complex protein Nup155-like protein, partial [Leptotrombidium deliense]
RHLIINEAVSLFKRIGARINLRNACDLLGSVYAFKEIVDLCLHTAAVCDEKSLGLYFYKNNEPQDDFNGSVVFSARMECYKVVLDVYEKLVNIKKGLMHQRSALNISPALPQTGSVEASLTPDDAGTIAEKILQLSLDSNDELMHVSFYDWLYEHGCKDKLLNVKSAFLETYLKRKVTHSPDSTKLMDLLWMYYEKLGHFRAAAHILDKLAEKHCSEIDLQQRLEYLSRAIICMKSCQTHLNKLSTDISDIKTSGEFLHELEEKMEVARIQSQILQCLRSFPESTTQIQHAVATLNNDLLDISQLYENFAERFDLPESQLAIVYSAGHYDPSLIENLWERIISKEIERNNGKPLSVQQMMYSNKLKSLTKLYLSSERYFPTDFIIQVFEYKTQHLGLEPDWLCRCLSSSGLSIPRLFDVYHKIYKSKEYSSTWPRKSIQTLRVLASLLSIFCENPSLMNDTERYSEVVIIHLINIYFRRRHFSTNCLDVIAGYLLDLQSSSLDPIISDVITNFRVLQSKLERMSS